MIVWLASYPRSGNTLVRTMLHQAFGLKSYSLHGRGDPDAFGSPALAAEIGHIDTDMTPEQLVDWARQDAGLHVIKTHEPPLNDDPAIYILRDGRSSVVSYWHFIRDIVGSPVTLEQVILGEVFAGKWSDHYRAWQPKIRPTTLLLRYEDITASRDAALTALSSFLRMPIQARTNIDFGELHGRNPKFFRSANDERNRRELVPFDDLFASENGDVMSYAGYDRP